MIGLVVRLAGLFGFSLSPLLAGVLVAGAITIGLGIVTMRIYNAGKASCEYGHLLATIAEKDRQLVEGEKIQQRDAKRAADAEDALRQNQEAVNATPANSAACLDRNAGGRIGRVRIRK